MNKQLQENIAVIGHPISHSLSPVIHGAAFAHLGIEARYDKIDVPKEEVSTKIGQMRDGYFRQFAVTIPNKEIALREADFSSSIATHIGAANTLTRMADGKILADNTDWIGVRDSLVEVGNWRDRKVLVLGAGGAARGAIHALQELDADIFITNRTESKAVELANHFGVQLGREDEDYHLIINTTSVGLHMKDEPENELNTPIDNRNLHSEMTIFDTVMIPLETKLLREAKEQGCHTIDGMRMLVYQGIEQLRIWTEVIDPELSKKVVAQKRELAALMRKAALEKLGIKDTNT